MLNLFPSSGGDSSRPPCRKQTPARPTARHRPEVECLEDRLVPAHIFVHHTADGAVMPIVNGIAPNLRSAIVNSHAGDEIDLDNATYVLSGAEGFGELDVIHNLYITNNAHGVSTIDGQGQTRVFEISGAEATPVKVKMNGLTVTGGDGNSSGVGGGIQVDGNAVLTLTHDTVTGNSVTGTPAQGGGIANFGTLNVISSTISNNKAMASVAQLGQVANAEGQGGGIFSSGGVVTLNSSTISGNLAQGGEYTVQDSSLQGYDGDGGGVALTGTASASIAFTTFANNKAQGAIPVGGAGTAGDGCGGGLFQDTGTQAVSIGSSTFSKNQAVGGAGTNSGSGGSDGGAGSGGGVYQEIGAGNLSVVNSTFGFNKAQGGASGLLPTVIRPQQIRPQQQGSGGGAGTAGGLYLGGSGTDSLTNVTIVQNVAAGGLGGGTSTGGGLVTAGAKGRNPAKVWNTLIAANTAAIDPDVFGAFVSLGHNLVGNPTGSVGFSTAKHDLLNVATSHLGLLPLGYYNGGLTQTFALSATSPAVDAGDDAVLSFLTTDQNGKPRKSGAHVDIGAFEFQVPLSSPPGRRNGPLF